MFYYDEHNRMLSYYKYLPNITSTVCYTYLPLTITRLSIPLSTKITAVLHSTTAIPC